jgi:hypothetical protein
MPGEVTDSDLETLIELVSADVCEPKEVCRLAVRRLDAMSRLNLRIHPYGFLHASLGQTNDGRGLRIHIWAGSDKARDVPTRVHAHAWVARSHLLLGGLTNEIYDVTEAVTEAESGQRQLFVVQYIDGASTRVPTTSRVTHSLVESREYVAGQTYDLEHGVYHRTVVPLDELTVTLFATAPKQSVPLVVGLQGEEVKERFNRDLVTTEAEDHLRAKVRAALTGSDSNGK